MVRRITALTVQKRNRQRVNVYLDGEFAFGLARIVAAWLHLGMELDDAKIAQLRAEDEREVAFQRALRLINYRPRTAAEIREKLERQSVPAQTIDSIFERLQTSGLVDDARFAKDWVENRAELRPRSRRALSYELKQRGVDQDTISEAIETIDDDELAYQAALRQAHKNENLDWREFRLKMLRHLAQRGFNYGTSSEAVRRVWEEIRGTGENLDEEADS
jgi:regulatory protein